MWGAHAVIDLLVIERKWKVVLIMSSMYFLFDTCGTLSFIPEKKLIEIHNIDGLVQERSNSSALGMELRLSCTNPSTWYVIMWHYQFAIYTCYSHIDGLVQDFTNYSQCWKFPHVCQSKADNFGGGPGTFCWFFFNLMFMIWDSSHEGLQLFDWVSNTDYSVLGINIQYATIYLSINVHLCI